MAELDAELARLWGTHRGEVDVRLATIDAAVEELSGGALGDEPRAAATRAAHQLAGTAGTFGFAQASAHAAELQQCLQDAQAPGDAPALEQLAAQLREALEDRRRGDGHE